MEIDIVVLWVDGNDPKWISEKNNWSRPDTQMSNTINRFRDWGLMPYWFRAIEQFSPWVRTIHFVTCGQTPSFLNTNHPKLHVVNHTEFIPNEWLPTFNSAAIELNIHRIDGLSEHFIYMNDDTFFLRPIKPTSFFINGFPCINGSERPIIPYNTNDIVSHHEFNDIGFINRHFNKRQQVKAYRTKYLNTVYGKKDYFKSLFSKIISPRFFVGFKNLHAPIPMLKTTLEEIWSAEPETLIQTSEHKFREMSDVNQWVALWWQVASGSFIPSAPDNSYFPIQEKTLLQICETIREQKHDMLCINDHDQSVNFSQCQNAILLAFNSLLPNKSSFEK